jgi:hypothetical protein
MSMSVACFFVFVCVSVNQDLCSEVLNDHRDCNYLSICSTGRPLCRQLEEGGLCCLMWPGFCDGALTIPSAPEEIQTSLMADKRNIIMSYRGVDIKVQIHSVLEEVEMRGWAKIKSAGVLSGGLVGLWCEASFYYPLFLWPWWMSLCLALSTLEVHMLSKLMLLLSVC